MPAAHLVDPYAFVQGDGGGEGEGGGGGGGEGGGGGGGGGGGAAMAIVGSDSTAMPSKAEAEATLPRLEESEACTAAAVVEVGTVRVAVMNTLAAAKERETDEAPRPAEAAIERWRAGVLSR